MLISIVSRPFMDDINSIIDYAIHKSIRWY